MNQPTKQQAITLLRTLTLSESQIDYTFKKYGDKVVLKALSYCYRFHKMNLKDFGTALKSMHFEIKAREKGWTEPVCTDIVDPARAREIAQNYKKSLLTNN